MIQIILQDNLSCPTFVCDACHRPIRNIGMAAYLWRVDTTTYEPENGTVYIVHKGACHREIEEAGGGRLHFAWDELSWLPARLANNSDGARQTIERLASRRRRVA